MTDEIRYKIGKIYFGILGIFVVLTGAIELSLGVLNKSIQVGFIVFSGYFMLWRGLILFFAGLFYIRSLKDFSNIHQQAKSIIASGMIWIIAVMNIFSMLLGSIPGGEDRWFNTLDAFLASYSPPYIPALILFPFSLLIAYYIRLDKKRMNKDESR